MSEKSKMILFIVLLIICGISLAIVINHFFPCADYMIPIIVVLLIDIYFEKELKKKK